MTSPAGGGSANLGTVTGKVRLTYESSQVRTAVRDVSQLSSVLSDVGGMATRTAKDVDRATSVMGQFGNMIQRLGQRVIPNPAQGLGTRVENETSRATKAIATLQRQATGTTLTGAIKLAPTKVEIDRRAIDTALRGTGLGAIRLTAPIQIAPSQITLDNKAIDAAVQGFQKSGVTLKVPITIEPTDVSMGSITKAVNAGSQGGGSGGGPSLLSAVPLLGRITAGAGVAAAAVGAVGLTFTKGFGRLASIDQATVKLSAMGLKLQDIQKISATALDAVQGTAFGLNESFNAAADAINAGIKPGKDLDKYLKATANTASLAGVGMQELGQGFSRAAVQGKLTGEIAQMLYDRQVPLLKLLADEYGVTQQKAQEMVSNGQVDFSHFIDAMSKTSGAAKAMGNTVQGSWQNLGAAVSRLGAGILAPLFAKKNADDASVVASAIQTVTDAVDNMGKFFTAHYSDVVTFWEVLGKGGVIAGKVFVGLVGIISDAVVKVAEVIGDTTGWLSTAFGTMASLFGASGVAKNAQKFADSMHNLGEGLRENRDINMGKMNRGLDSAWSGLDRWAKGARDAGAAGRGLGSDANALAPKLVPVKDALDKLQIKADAAKSAMEGTTEQFKAFLDQVKQKGGTDALLSTLEQMRSKFDNGGRQIKAYATAIDGLKDSTKDAASRANDLITSLQGLGLLPGGEALESYNKAFATMTSYMGNIIDLADTTGNSLANLDGTLNLNTKNGQNLLDQIRDIRKEMVTLATSGEATPDEAYARTVQGLNDLLQRQAGLSPDVAQQVIDKYLPKDAIVNSLKAQDPKSAIEGIFKDPAKIKSELDLLTSSKDILGQIVGPDGSLHIPTVLDGPGNSPFGPHAVPKPGAGPNADSSSGAPSIAPQDQPDRKPPPLPPVGPKPGPLPVPKGPIAPSDLGGLLGAGMDAAQSASLINLANNKGALDKALGDNPEIQKQLQSLVDQANSQGQNMGTAFAQGLLTSTDDVRRALLQLATLAGDYLGNSPAKYGPLSGSGWTLSRGKTFTTDWAKGIESESASAAKAASNTAGAAAGGLSAGGGGSTLGDGIKQLVGDLQQFSDFGKHLLSLGQQVADIAIGIGKFANDMSGGSLFPHTYKKDPKFDARRGSVLGAWNPAGSGQPRPGQTAAGPAGAPGPGGPAPGPLGAQPDKQGVANYIISKALSQGYSREQANAIATQAFGESGFKADISGGQQGADPNADTVLGIFQEKPGFAKAGGIDPSQRTNAQANIDAYFANLAKAGGPSAPDIKQLLANVSAGGPAHPSNVGHWDRALQGVQPYLQAFQPSTGVGAAPAGPPVPPPSGGFPAYGQPGGNYSLKDISQSAGVHWEPGKGYVRADGSIVQPGSPAAGPAGPKTSKAPIGPQVVPPGTLPPLLPDSSSQAPSFAPQDQPPVPPAGLPGVGPKPSSPLAPSFYKDWYGSGVAAPQVPYGLPPHTDTGGYGTGTGATFPDWVMQLGAQFGLKPSTYPGHQEDLGKGQIGVGRQEKGYAPNPQNLNRGIDWTGSNEDMQRFAEYLQGIAPNAPGLEQIIWQNPKTMGKIGLGGAGNPTQGYYPDTGDGSYQEHQTHVHTRSSTSIPLPGQVPQGLQPGTAAGSPGTPVTITGQANDSLKGIFDNTGGLPSLPGQLQGIVGNDPLLQNALANQSSLTSDTVVPVLQRLDGLISQQNKQGTPQSKAIADALGTYKGNLAGQFGMEEGPSTLDQAQTMISGVGSIAQDVFGLFDQGLKTIAATQDIGDTLVRGVANTKDVNRLIDDAQEWITLFQKGFQTASDIAGFAGQFTGGDPTGISGMATGAVSALTGLIAQGLAAVNTAIDLGQEAYAIVTKYVGRFIQSWTGLSGASDVKYLLDEVTGTVAAYSSDNPQDKHVFNQLGKSLGAGGYADSRKSVVNNNTIYQGPGQDPRDTMSDMMFGIRSASVGVFGYDD